MRQRLLLLSSTAVRALVLMILCGGVCQAAPRATLETMCDSVGVLKTSYAAASFDESCALLESTIRQALLHSEDAQADAVRKRLTLKSTVTPPGSVPFRVSSPSLTCTIRELVRQFAATWKVAATISGDQILFSKLPAKTSEAPDAVRAQ